MKNKKLLSRLNRKRRIRRQRFGTTKVLRLNVYRSLINIYAKLNNVNEGVT